MRTTLTDLTQLDLLTSAIKWLSTRTGVPFDQLSNHMMVISDTARVLERYGSIYGEPTEFDYEFNRKDWDGVYELISQIWHEDK